MSGATPRVTRSRTNTPLPAIQARQSHAYGAQGKAALSQQVTTSSADLNAAFSSTARPRGSTRPASQSATPAPAVRKPKPKATTPIIEEDDDDEADNDEPAEDDHDELSRPGTAVQNSAAYINVPEVPSSRPQRPAAPPIRPQRPSVQPARPQLPNGLAGNDADFEPDRASILFRTIPRYLERLFGDGWRFIVMCILSLLVFLAIMSPLAYLVGAGWAATRDFPYTMGLQNNYNAFKTSQLFSDDIQKLNISEHQWAINAHLLGRIEILEVNATTTQQDFAIQQAMIEELQSILPNTIVLAEEDGEFTVPPLFWQALSHKMQDPSASPIWQHFLDSNAQQLQSLSKDVFANDFEEMVKSGRVISHEDFNVVLSKHSKAVHDDLERVAAKLHSSVADTARNFAIDALEHSDIMALARKHMSQLAQANYIYNIDKRLRQINYFGIGLGALVDPFYTSSTKLPSTQTWFQYALHLTGLARQYPHPPAMALTPWSEATEAWCAATSKDEKAMAQLTVKTAHKIYPTEITLEHIPRSGTRDIASAPRHYEVWVQVANSTEATRIKDTLPTVDNNMSTLPGVCEGVAPNGEKNWVCMAAGTYDINDLNFVQPLAIYNAEKYRVATDRIALRVISNHGAEGHTCLYRVLATGLEI